MLKLIIKKGLTIKVKFSGNKKKLYEGVVSAVSSRINAETRSILIRVKIVNKNSELIWASTRELYNIYQANNIKCDIITVTTDVLNKFNLLNYNLNKYSLDTVKGFRNDAIKSKFRI